MAAADLDVEDRRGIAAVTPHLRSIEIRPNHAHAGDDPARAAKMPGN
jgi:hypothetical protein